ncbi:hypothetical protein KUL118_01250 [Tenacibaculum sp. KUL118]|nr:hypothetical protein KUL118_01250 [Tenacibaculum sp. KUL118]
MYRHFFTRYGGRFTLFLTSLLIFTSVLNRFLVEGQWELKSLSDLLSYYAVMFSCIIIAGVMVRGFNNRIVLALIIIASISEQIISSLMFSISPTLHTAIAMTYVPGIITMFLYQYRVQFQFWLANKLIQSERFRNKGLYLLDKTEDTNLGTAINIINKLGWVVCFSIATYYHIFTIHFGIHETGPLLYGYRLVDIEYALHLPSFYFLFNIVFVTQTIMLLGLLFHASIQEFYVKDLAGSIPKKLEVLFKRAA